MNRLQSGRGADEESEASRTAPVVRASSTGATSRSATRARGSRPRPREVVLSRSSSTRATSTPRSKSTLMSSTSGRSTDALDDPRRPPRHDSIAECTLLRCCRESRDGYPLPLLERYADLPVGTDRRIPELRFRGASRVRTRRRRRTAHLDRRCRPCRGPWTSSRCRSCTVRRTCPPGRSYARSSIHTPPGSRDTPAAARAPNRRCCRR